jgi:chemotaxis methyl-accepting protein methylase
MPLKPEQVDLFLKTVNERTPPAPLSKAVFEQRRFVEEQLPAAFESIGIVTVSDPALKAALNSDSYLHTLRERALYVQPADLFSRKFFRFRGRLPMLHALMVRLFTDAAGLGERKIRIWNPFCGWGADTYSIAALARLAQTTTGTSIRTIEVIGSDLLPAALKAAGEGRYTFNPAEWQAYRTKLVEMFGEQSVTDDDKLPISTRHLPPGVETMFSVSRLPEGGYTITVDDALRKITTFRPVNLFRIAEIGQLGGFDMVVTLHPCVVADDPAAEKYRAALACAVRTGGYVIAPEMPPTPLGGKPKLPHPSLDVVEPGLYCRVR